MTPCRSGHLAVHLLIVVRPWCSLFKDCDSTINQRLGLRPW